ncbi:hypothetical protein TREES_T100017551 [Tupaia chinensis]|uniref:Uncharacterized protein n=1 Tax=Tupaia chinensis TaxID=246437 RepID=L9L7U1_TUPCH|nr:hypothetical protein TREES_T100017551 [Tupaia chinensis]
MAVKLIIEGTSQPSGQACQKNPKYLEKEVHGDTLEIMFHQTGASGKSKKTGEKFNCRSSFDICVIEMIKVFSNQPTPR